MCFGNRPAKSFCRLFLMLFVALLTIPTFAAAASKTVADGKITITDTASKITVNDQTKATITAVKSWSLSGGTATNTITVQNTSGSTAKISFNYIVSGHSNFSITGSGEDTSSMYSVILDNNATITITLSAYAAKYSSQTATLEMSNITLTPVADSASITVNYDRNIGGVKADGESIESGSSVSVTSVGIDLIAEPIDGATFIAWVDASNKVQSTSKTWRLTPTDGLTAVTAIFTVDSPWFYVNNGSYLYEGLATAIANAGSDKLFVLANDARLPSGTYEIPAGYTMLIPFDSAGTVVTNSNLADNVVAYEDAHNVHTLFRELTLSSGTNIQVNGSVSVASKVYAQGTGQDGPYGQITMYEGSSMTLNRGSNLYVFGYIRGSGTIDVTSGANVYESMCVLDYPGSASSTNNLVNAKAFPFSKFTVQNVEVPMTLRSGAAEKVFYNFYGSSSLVGYRNTWVEFFGTASTSFLKTSDYLIKSYRNNRQCFEMNGTCSLNDITIQVGSLISSITVETTNLSGVTIPYNFDILVNSGTTTLSANTILSKGSTVTVNSGATINIASDKKFYVMDSTEDPQNVGNQNDAKLDINGTVTVNGGLLTSASGANIISSGKTGTIQYSANAASQTDITIKTGSGANYKTISCTAAKLKNADGKYIGTKDAKAGDTFTYCKCQDCGDGTWVKDVAAINDSTGTQGDTYSTLEAAVKAYSPDNNTAPTNYIKLLHNTTEKTISVSNKSLYLDLNGRTVTGDISVTGAYKLYGMDSSAKADYTTAPTGKIVGTVTGTVAPTYQTPKVNEEYDCYVAIPGTEADGNTPNLSFHRFNISVTGYRFELTTGDTPQCALFFIGKFQGDDAAKNHLTSLGFTLKDENGNQLGEDNYKFTAGTVFPPMPKEGEASDSEVVCSGDAYLFEAYLKRSFDKAKPDGYTKNISATAQATFDNGGKQQSDSRNLSFEDAWTNPGELDETQQAILDKFLKELGITKQAE